MPVSLEEAARSAVKRFPGSSIEVAIAFFETAFSDFIGTSNDRLVKAGRSIVSLIDLADDPDDEIKIPLNESLELLVQESQLLLSGEVKVPKVRFGKTELQMPIVTLGCMRFQEEWGPRIQAMDLVGSDCQDNLKEILTTAIGYGITHIETARGYGCSELQIGCALKQLFLAKKVKREDLIIQSKIPPNKDIKAFEQAVETTFKCLQVEWLDLFAFHGFNFAEQLPWVFGDGSGNENTSDECKNCWDVIQKYKKAGKIRHVGFSTHGATSLILECINKDCFDYVNLHYHYFGSYTASGGGHDGNGNLDCVKLAHEKDMGIFIISPFDKGGRVYAPSRKLRSLTLPDLEPMAFGTNWIWNHHEIYKEVPQLHTFTVGAGRPSDLDNPAVQAYLHASKKAETLTKVTTTLQRLEDAKEKALGKLWLDSWWKGLPKARESKHLVEHNQIVWLFNSIMAFGMYDFAKARYNSFEKNGEKWDDKLSAQENIDKKIGANAWGFVPGLPLKPDLSLYDDDLVNVPLENMAMVKHAHEFVYKWCRDPNIGHPDTGNPVADFLRRNFSVSTQLFQLPSFGENDKQGPETAEVPSEWKTAYDMRPWPDYPDQPQRNIGAL